MKYFDGALVLKTLRRFGRILVYLLITMLVGIFIGFAITGQNPIKVIFPTTWIHIFEFLS